MFLEIVYRSLNIQIHQINIFIIVSSPSKILKPQKESLNYFLCDSGLLRP